MGLARSHLERVNAGMLRTPAAIGVSEVLLSLLAVALSWTQPVLAQVAGSDFQAVVPDGVRVVWDLSRAQREATPTRERICLNGLWRWQPAGPVDEPVPDRHWGFFKVPGAWPGITDYMQKDSQSVIHHPDWRGLRLGDITAAWYEREVAIPADWAGRRITVHFELLNSHADVSIDGTHVGEARFPDGEVDLSAACRPGAVHRLSLRVTAMPLQAVLQSYTDSAAAREVRGAVARRGLCGDVQLIGSPRGPRIGDVRISTSVRRGELGIGASLEGLPLDARYTLRGRVVAGAGEAHEFASRTFSAKDVGATGRFEFREPWKPSGLWDTGTPGNRCELELSLVDEAGTRLDTHWKDRFGFREFWIEGRDFVLNGTPIHLSTVPMDNAQVGAAWASYAGARESLERLQGFGINFVYTHNYDCLPGSHLAFEEILRAADDVGVLVALSQPHFSHYDWKGGDADRTNGYARHAAAYVRVAANHPSVVMYAMSHNATGYNEDMNPDMIDGVQSARDEWAERNVRSARRAESIVQALDPVRTVYHHASGNLGPLHAINFYPNFAPIQELSDWFEHWSTKGVKPVFLCEYGAPFTWDWTMYRGWYRGEREFGSAKVPWEFCLAEWNAQFVGDRAFPASEAEKANLRWESGQFREGRLWHRWDYPADVGSGRFDERYPIFAAYLTDNWRAFRTWGVSVVSPWEHGHFWKLRPGTDRSRKSLRVDWDDLQRPGFSADFLDQRYERVDLAYERSDWIATVAAESLYRNNRSFLAYVAGPPARLTSKDHEFHAGEVVEKSLVLINDSRLAVAVQATWEIRLPEKISGSHEFRIEPGAQERWPLRIEIPSSAPSGRYEIRAKARFGSGETQDDVFALDVSPRPDPVRASARLAVFDPAGKTAAWLEGLGVSARRVGAAADLRDVDVLVVGREALSIDGAAPDIRRVRDGLRVLVFEQSAEVLERRFGFRVTEYGLRQVYPRVPDHPAIAGVTAEQLRDWHGEATLLPPRLKYEMRPRHGPTVTWCGLPVTRLWRCGNRGSVASVLIEKPARGDFLPILDGGYALQYSPLMEYREGQGSVMFCQLDVTGRTDPDPVAERVARNLLRHAMEPGPRVPSKRALYAGDEAGLLRLRAQGFAVESYAGGRLDPDVALVVGPGGSAAITNAADWFRVGGRILTLGLGPADFGALPWLNVTVRTGEHVSTGFPPFASGSPMAGIGPADLHWREPRDVALVTGGAQVFGDGVLGQDRGAVFCQFAPWEFDGRASMSLKRTARRSSVLLSRLVSNLGVACTTPLLGRFGTPVDSAHPENRWMEGLYLDVPEEWDDPYRFFRW